ncbi:MAG TPA: IS110 family transposase [Gammaproteobacteria bacterium]
MEEIVLGIDIAKRKFDVALLREGKFKNKAFANTATGFLALRDWLQKHQVEQMHACMEATSRYGEALAFDLLDAGHKVSIVNPAQIKAFGRSQLSRNKTDEADARLIAQFCFHFKPPQWMPPSAEVRELQALVHRLESLQDMRLQEISRLESADITVVPDLQSHIEFLEQRITATRQRIKDHIDNHPDLRRKRELLKSIPGVGEGTLAMVLAYIPVERFGCARQLAAFIGLTPRQRRSGSSVKGRTVLSKTGNARLRKALYMPALTAIRHNPVLKAFYERLLAAGKNGKAAVCAVMRKLTHIIFGVLKNQQPFDPEWKAC